MNKELDRDNQVTNCDIEHMEDVRNFVFSEKEIALFRIFNNRLLELISQYNFEDVSMQYYIRYGRGYTRIIIRNSYIGPIHCIELWIKSEKNTEELMKIFGDIMDIIHIHKYNEWSIEGFPKVELLSDKEGLTKRIIKLLHF